jgi:2-hydroxychromene-2-carboxylate isomerase
MRRDTVEFHFDIGSPNAYLSHMLIPAIEQRTGRKFVYVPVLLGGIFKLTNNQPPMLAFRGVRNKLAYEQREIERFVQLHGLTRFRMNPYFPLNTLLAMRMAVAAGLDGVLAAYAGAVFRGMWEDGLQLDDPDVLRGLLDRAGLDADRLLGQARDQVIKDRLLQNTEASVARGAFGSPTFFLGEEMYFGKDRLRDVEAAITRDARTGTAEN